MSDRPDVSVIVPCYNRASLLGYSLESIRRGRSGLQVEVIVVDDGSEPALDPSLASIRAVDARVIRQPNQGLLFARLRGLAEARGRHVLFLDSDDLVTPGKLRAQVLAMDETGADVSYTDAARCTLVGSYDSLAVEPEPGLRRTADVPEFFIHVQPPPHSPLWRTDFVRRVVESAFFPPEPAYNPVAEIWFYHNAAVHEGSVLFVPDELAIVGSHGGARLTSQWERLAAASLFVMERFAATAPQGTPSADRARRFVAERAFGSWRGAPRGFSRTFDRRMLDVWRQLSRSATDPTRLGAAGFSVLSRLLGPVAAGRLVKLWKTRSYASCRTMSDCEFDDILASVPPPNRA